MIYNVIDLIHQFACPPDPTGKFYYLFYSLSCTILHEIRAVYTLK